MKLIIFLLLAIITEAHAVTKVRPLYLSPLTNTTQVSATRDYLSVKGIAFLADDNTRLYSDAVGNIRVDGSLASSGTIATTRLLFSDGTSMTSAGVTGSIDADTLDGIDSSGFLQTGNNLFELTNIVIARSNLGLGTIATQNSNAISITGGDISTSGSISASYFSGNGSNLTSVNASLLNGLSDTAFLKTANNLSDLTNFPLARSNLGLGSMATQNSTAVSITGGDISTSGYVSATGFSGNGANLSNVNATTISGAASSSFLWRNNNLSDLTDASAARSNLGLGTMATQNSSAVSITGGNISTSGAISANTVTATVATGTSPFFVSSTTKVTNLNVDSLDDQTGSFYLDRTNHTGSQLSTTISDFNEAAQDAVGTTLTTNNPITWTYNDAANTITAGLNYTSNFKLTSNFLDTIQDIKTSSSPTFGGLTVNGSAIIAAEVVGTSQINNFLTIGGTSAISGGALLSVAGGISGTSLNIVNTIVSSGISNTGMISNTGNFSNNGNITNGGSFATLGAGYVLSQLNVGAGTLNQLTFLNIVNSGNGSTLALWQNSDTGYLSTDGGYIGLSSAEVFQVVNQENTDMLFGTNNLARMTIDSGGNVGIGPGTSPGAFLDVAGGISGTSLSLFNGQSISGSSNINGFQTINSTASIPNSGSALLTVNGGISTTGKLTSNTGASITGASSWDYALSRGNAYVATFNNTSNVNGSSAARFDGFTNGIFALASGGSGSAGYGGYFQNSNNLGNNIGVRGDVGAGASVNQFGGYFQARTSGAGATGAFGETTNVTVAGYGLYGKVASPNSYALYGLNTTNGPAAFLSGTTIISGGLTVNSATSAPLDGSALSVSGIASATFLTTAFAASFTGTLSITGPNQRIFIPSNANGITGSCVLVAGTCTVVNTNIKANSNIILGMITPGGVQGATYVSAKTAATSFVVNSTNTLDTSTIGYKIEEY